MNTAVTLDLPLRNTLDALASAAAANTVRSTAATLARLERIRADRELILQPLEPDTSAGPGTTAPVTIGMTVSVAEVPLPGSGWAEPVATAAPVEPAALEGSIDSGIVAPGPVGAASSGAVGDADPAAPQGVAGFAASTVTKRELSFLDDRSLSIEEKLFRFMILMTKKSDQDLLNYMKEIGGKKTTSSSGNSSGSTGAGSTSGTSGSPDSTGGAGSADTTDPADDASPTDDASLNPAYRDLLTGMSPQAVHDKYGYDAMQLINLTQRADPNSYAGFFSAADRVGVAVAHGAAWAAHEFAGPALAAGVTALGMPVLAPVAKMVGSELGDVLADGLNRLAEGASDAGSAAATGTGSSAPTDVPAGANLAAATSSTTGSSSSTGSSSTSGSAASPADERIQAYNLQRLIEKQQAMFTLLSNILKVQHDTQMTAVQNLR